jgi:hypothetical protein
MLLSPRENACMFVALSSVLSMCCCWCVVRSAGLLASTYIEVQEVQQVKESYDALLVSCPAHHSPGPLQQQ